MSYFSRIRIIILAIILTISVFTFGCRNTEPDDHTVVTTATPAPSSDVKDKPAPTDAHQTNATPSVTDPAVTDVPVTSAPTDVSAPTAAPDPAPVPIESVLTYYNSFLFDYFNEHPDYYETARFYMGFIDDDDIPELFIAPDFGYDTKVDVFKYSSLSGANYVGSFGSSGSFWYISRQNRIESSISYTSYLDSEYYEIGEDGKANLLADLRIDFLPDETAEYSINGKPADQDAFNAYNNEIYNTDEHADTSVWFSSTQSYSAFNRGDRAAILADIYDTILNEEEYEGYIPESIDNICGTWHLDHYTMINKTTREEQVFSASDLSRVSLYASGHMYYKFVDSESGSDYIAEATDNSLTYCGYKGLDDAPTDFFYCVSGFFGDREVFMTYFTDDDGLLWMELMIINDDYSDSDYHLFFLKDYEPFGTHFFGKIEPYPAGDTDEFFAYKFREYELVAYYSSDELKAEYGFPADNDTGYEVYPKHDTEEKIIFGYKTSSNRDFSTYYRVIEQDDYIHDVQVDGNEFVVLVNQYGSMFVNIFLIDQGKGICNSIIEEYIG